MNPSGVACTLGEVHHVRAYMSVIGPNGASTVGGSPGDRYGDDSGSDARIVGLTDALVVIWRLRLLVGSATRAAVRALISDWDDEFGRVGVPVVVQLSWWITGVNPELSRHDKHAQVEPGPHISLL